LTGEAMAQEVQAGGKGLAGLVAIAADVT